MNPSFATILPWDLSFLTRLRESRRLQDLAWALKNLTRNPKRSLASVSAVATGFAGLVLLGGYIYRIERYLFVSHVYVNQQGHVTLFKKGGVERARARPARYSLTAKDQAAIASVLADLAPEYGIDRVGRRLEISGLIGSRGASLPFLAVGVEPELDRWARTHAQVQHWTPELAGTPAFGTGAGAEASAVTLTPALARKLGLAAAGGAPDWVQLASSGLGGRFEVAEARWVGAHTTGMALTEETSVRMPLALAQRLADSDAVTSISVFLKRGNHAEALAQAVAARLEAQGLAVDALPYANDRTGLFYTGGVSFLGVMGGFFLVLILGAVVFSIVNAFTLMLGERKKELGTLRSLGFTPRQIQGLLTQESLCMAGAGIGAGGAASILLASWVNGLGIRFHSPGIAGDMQLVITPNAWLSLFFAVALTTLVTGAASLVARKLLKSNPSSLLQTE